MPDLLLVGIDDVSLSEINANVCPRISAFRATAFEPKGFSHPVCSQSRQAILFGSWGKKIGTWRDIGSTVPNEATPDASLPTLPGVLAAAGYATCLVGKWHLGPAPSGGHWATGPLERGYEDWLAGTRLNVSPGTYTDWERVDCDSLGNFSIQANATQHAALAQLDAADFWWSAHADDNRFLHVCLNLPHDPKHTPPASLLAGWTIPPFPSNRQRYLAMLRAADTAFGQLLDLVGPDVPAILYSDNGTSVSSLPAGSNPLKAKETTFDGGIRVVMMGRWPGCPAGQSSDLNHLVDIPAAACAILGVAQPAGWDSQIGGRQYILSEAELGSGTVDRCCRTSLYKLRQVTQLGQATAEELYDMVNDPNEGVPLNLSDPQYAAALAYLRGKLDAAAI